MKFQLNSNAANPADPYPSRLKPILSLERYREARREIGSWEGYRPTPLLSLPGVAAKLGVGTIWYKDEGDRFGLGSFKALGGAYAAGRSLLRRLQALGIASADTSLSDLRDGRFASALADMTVVTATDGNHGRAVAWGARTFGSQAIIYLHAHVSANREAAIKALGAETVRVPGNYDDAVRQAAADAAEHGYLVVSDTSYDGYCDVPADVMQGYTVLVGEILDRPEATPTHVFLQAGVGAFAAAVCAHLWEALGRCRPSFIVVEPDVADCLYRSAAAGHPVAVGGIHATIMAGLACGEASELAWQVLSQGANAFVIVDDDDARAAVRQLYRPVKGDPQIIAGESGAAGLAGLMAVKSSMEASNALGLDTNSRILLIGTESNTDPESFAAIVGSEDARRSPVRSGVLTPTRRRRATPSRG